MGTSPAWPRMAATRLGGVLTAGGHRCGHRRRRRHGDLELQRGQQRHAVPGGRARPRPRRFTVTIADGNGGTVDQLITVTVTGTNDAPTISAADASGAVTEDASAPTLSDSGTITFDDLDLTDGHITSVAADGGNTSGRGADGGGQRCGERGRRRHGDLELQRGQQRHAVPGGRADRDAKPSRSRSPTAMAARSDQLITVTVTGTNDAPTISAADASGAVTEDASAPTLSDSGTITFDDLDLTDGHITSVAADGGNTSGWGADGGGQRCGERGRRRHGDLGLQRGQQRHAVPGGRADRERNLHGHDRRRQWRHGGSADHHHGDRHQRCADHQRGGCERGGDRGRECADAQRQRHDHVRRPRPDRWAHHQRGRGWRQHVWVGC